MADERRIVWIASYPKSGNTWVRFLVCNLIFGPQDSAIALNQFAPDVHELQLLPQSLPPRVLLKTHFQFSARMPYAAQTAGAIYIVRHPADVLLSNFHYSQRSGAVGGANALALNQYVEQFLAHRGDPQWQRLGMGGWDENVHSWLGASHPFPVLRLRYEDLLADPVSGAMRLRAFLGIQRSAEDVSRAAAASSFERLRAIEEADIAARKVGIFYKPYLQTSIQAGLRFMRSGRSGEAMRALTPAQRERVGEAFGRTLSACGYVPADGAQGGEAA